MFLIGKVLIGKGSSKKHRKRTGSRAWYRRRLCQYSEEVGTVADTRMSQSAMRGEGSSGRCIITMGPLTGASHHGAEAFRGEERRSDKEEIPGEEKRRRDTETVKNSTVNNGMESKDHGAGGASAGLNHRVPQGDVARSNVTVQTNIGFKQVTPDIARRSTEVQSLSRSLEHRGAINGHHNAGPPVQPPPSMGEDPGRTKPEKEQPGRNNAAEERRQGHMDSGENPTTSIDGVRLKNTQRSGVSLPFSSASSIPRKETAAMSKEAHVLSPPPKTQVSHSKAQQALARARDSQIPLSKNQKPLPDSKDPPVAAVKDSGQKRIGDSAAHNPKRSNEKVERKPGGSTKHVQAEERRAPQRTQEMLGSIIANAASYLSGSSKCNKCTTKAEELTNAQKQLQTVTGHVSSLDKKLNEKGTAMRQLEREIGTLKRDLQERNEIIKRFTEEKESIAVKLDKARESLANVQTSKREESEKFEKEIKALQTTIMHRKKDLNANTTDDPTIKSKYQSICRKVNAFLRSLIRHDPNSNTHFDIVELLDHGPFFEYLPKMLPNRRVSILLCHLLNLQSKEDMQGRWTLLNDVITGIVMNIIVEEIFDQELRILGDDFQLSFSNLFTVVKDFNSADPGRLSAVMIWRSDLFRMLSRESRSRTGDEEFPIEFRSKELVERVGKQIVNVLNPIFRNYKTSSTSEDDFKRKTAEGLHGIIEMALDLALILARQRADYRFNEPAVTFESGTNSSAGSEAQLRGPEFVIYPGLVKWGNEDAKNFDEPLTICPPKVYHLSEDATDLIRYFKFELSLEYAIIRTCFTPRKTAIPNADVILELLNMFPAGGSTPLLSDSGTENLDLGEASPNAPAPRSISM